jgi:hypothetical protein
MNRNPNRGLLMAAVLGGAAYWASKQPGGMKGTWNRLQQGMRDIQNGQDPRMVAQRFIQGKDPLPNDPAQADAVAQTGGGEFTQTSYGMP